MSETLNPQIKTDIINLLRREARSFKSRELYNALGKPGPYDEFKRILTALLKDGAIIRGRKRNWFVTDETRDAPVFLTGALMLNRNQTAFVYPRDGGDRIFIRRGDLRGAIQGDQVRVKLLPGQKGPSREGRIVSVLEHKLGYILGRIEYYGKKTIVMPISSQISQTIRVRHSNVELQAGMHVLARLNFHSDNDRAGIEADIVRSYEENSRAELLQEAVKRSAMLPVDFPEDVLAAAEAMDDTITLNNGREDMRDWLTLTIDPADAKDFDDAVSIEPLAGGGVRLGVHIADVTHFVKSGTPVDREAENRSTSVYMPGEVVPMLPQRLSSDLCSLRPDEDRYAMSVIMDLDERANVRSYRITPSVIRSRFRFDYDQAAALLARVPKIRKKGFDPDRDLQEPIERVFYQMNLLYRKLKRKRIRQGSLDFNTPEPHFILDSTGFPTEIQIKRYLASNQMIEEFMLLANQTVARHLVDAEKNGLYRVHEPPSGQKLARFCDFIRHMGGEKIDERSLLKVKGWQEVLERFRGTETELVLEEVVLRSMMKAVYTAENRGHFGLAFDYYTHFTSPIRRYPDLIVHRLLKLLHHDRTIPKGRLEAIGNRSTEREVMATEAEREAVKIKQLLYLENQVGQRYRGVVRGVESFGLFVELEDVLLDGLVPMAELTDDYYDYDDKAWEIRGRHSGTSYTLGASLFVEITRVDVNERQLDLRIVDSLQVVRHEDADPAEKPLARPLRQKAGSGRTPASDKSRRSASPRKERSPRAKGRKTSKRR